MQFIKPNLILYFDFRNGRYFEPILNYLRTGQIIYEKSLNVQAILEEAKFFGIQEMIDSLQHLVECSSSRTEDNAPLTRQDVVRVLIQSSHLDELRFQVVSCSSLIAGSLKLFTFRASI